MNEETKKYLKEQANQMRIEAIKCIGHLGSGHVGGCMSIIEALTVLYFHEMNIDPDNPGMENRDKLVVSKGHAGPAVYAALALKGYFPMSELETLNEPLTRLPSHCDMTKTPGIDMTAGSLGQGLSCAVGMAIAAKIKGSSETVYAIIGDGESQEGQIWEASMAASHYKLDNLIVFLDYNKLQIDGPVEEVMNLGSPAEKWAAFGFDVTEVTDGNNVEQIADAIDRMKIMKDKRPKMIILNTKKGKGLAFAEELGPACHYMPVTKEQLESALKDLQQEVN